MITADTRNALAAADLSPEDMMLVPGNVLHRSALLCDAYLDEMGSRLVFVGVSGSKIAKFLYYCGEEMKDVEALARGVIAVSVSDDRIDWLKDRIEQAAARE